MKGKAIDHAQHGTLAAMLDGFREDVVTPNRPADQRYFALLDFNAGALAALTVMHVELGKGKSPAVTLERLLSEAHAIHVGLNPENFKRTRQ